MSQSDSEIIAIPTNCSFCKADLSDGLWAWAKGGALCKKCWKLAMKRDSEKYFKEALEKWEIQGWAKPKPAKQKWRK